MHARLQCVLWAAGGRYQQTHLIHMFLCTGRLPRDYGLESGLCNIAMINNHTREVSGLKAPPLTKRPPQFTAGRFSLPFFAFFAIFHELRHEIVGPVKITFSGETILWIAGPTEDYFFGTRNFYSRYNRNLAGTEKRTSRYAAFCSYAKRHRQNARIAQLVEHSTDTRKVLGSNPSARTKYGTNFSKSLKRSCKSSMYSLSHSKGPRFEP